MKAMPLFFFCSVLCCACLSAFGNGSAADANAAASGEQLESYWLTGMPAESHVIELLDGGTLDIAAQTGKVVLAGFIRYNMDRKMDEMVEALGETARRHADNPDVMVVCSFEPQGEELLEAYKTAAQKADPALITGINTNSDTAFGQGTVFVLIQPNGSIGKHKAYFAPAAAGAMLDAAIAEALNTEPEEHIPLSPLEWTLRSGRAPYDFTFRLPDGKTLSPSDLRGKATLLALGGVGGQTDDKRIFRILDAIARDYQDNPTVQFFGAATPFRITDEEAFEAIADWGFSYPIGITDTWLFSLYDYYAFVLMDADGLVQGMSKLWGERKEEYLRIALELLLSGIKPSSADPRLPEYKMELKAGVTRFSLSGQPAPELEYPLLDGGTFRLSEQKGKTVVVDFWATWCGPCMGSFPINNTIAEYFSDRDDVMVVGICMDGIQARDRVEELVETHKAAYPIALGSRNWEEGADYHIRFIPCPILIGPDGIIQGRISRIDEDQVAVAAIQTLLDGGTLPGATPYTRKELEYLDIFDPDENSQHDDIPPAAFRLTKTLALPGEVDEDTTIAFRHRDAGQFRYAIPQQFSVFCNDRNAVIMDIESGTLHAEATLPEGTALGASAVYARNPRGGSVVGIHDEMLTGIPLEKDGTPWSRSLGTAGSIGLYILPVSPEEDVVLAFDHSKRKMSFYDTDGNAMFSLRMPYPLQYLYILPDGKGGTSFVLYNTTEAFFYDFIFPPEPVEEEE